MARIRTLSPDVWRELEGLEGWLDSDRFYSPTAAWTPPARREWWIYFVQGDDGGPVKIGRTRNLVARICDLQIGYPFGELAFAAVFRGVDQDERQLHQRFAHLHVRGEWFLPKPELADFIRSLPEPV